MYTNKRLLSHLSIYLLGELLSNDLLSSNPKASWRVHKIPSKQSTALIFLEG